MLPVNGDGGDDGSGDGALAVQLPDGRVVVVSADGGVEVVKASVPAAGACAALDGESMGGAAPVAARLPDGRVLVVGVDGGVEVLPAGPTSERDGRSSSGGVDVSSDEPLAARLPDGRVIVVNGDGSIDVVASVITTAASDGGGDGSVPAESPGSDGRGPIAAVLPDGRVVVISSDGLVSVATSRAAAVDTPQGQQPSAPASVAPVPSSTRLPDGRTIVVTADGAVVVLPAPPSSSSVGADGAADGGSSGDAGTTDAGTTDGAAAPVPTPAPYAVRLPDGRVVVVAGDGGMQMYGSVADAAVAGAGGLPVAVDGVVSTVVLADLPPLPPAAVTTDDAPSSDAVVNLGLTLDDCALHTPLHHRYSALALLGSAAPSPRDGAANFTLPPLSSAAPTPVGPPLAGRRRSSVKASLAAGATPGGTPGDGHVLPRVVSRGMLAGLEVLSPLNGSSGNLLSGLTRADSLGQLARVDSTGQLLPRRSVLNLPGSGLNLALNGSGLLGSPGTASSTSPGTVARNRSYTRGLLAAALADTPLSPMGAIVFPNADEEGGQWGSSSHNNNNNNNNNNNDNVDNSTMSDGLSEPYSPSRAARRRGNGPWSDNGDAPPQVCSECVHDGEDLAILQAAASGHAQVR